MSLAQRWQTHVNIPSSRHHQGVRPRQQHLLLGEQRKHRATPKLPHTAQNNNTKQ